MSTVLHQVSHQALPPGMNKHLRDISKVLLGLVVLLLVSNRTWFSFLAMVSSVGAIFHLKEGTFLSTKNIKWMTLSVISFGASLTSFIMLHNRDSINPDKAYLLSSFLWMGAKFVQLGWGIPLSLFLLSTWMSSSSFTAVSSSETTMTPLPPPQPRPPPIPAKSY